ncbi:MAG: hypothetical protein ACKVY0_25215 [Prosthecobacter sp.]|uniref:hypothetical protein n=1 Tax=Prosthecobacter sp. TaxID=1965333 RepID=UPI0038FED961
MRDSSSDDPASSAKPPSRWGNIFIGLLLGGVIGAGALYVTKVDPTLLAKVTSPSASPAIAAAGEEVEVPVKHEGLPRTPFEMGNLPADEVVDSIKITLGVGTEGAALSEPVDVHLGLGFPLRLYPLGGMRREPSFAAFPHRSSLAGMVTAIQPGQMATFEFSAKAGDAGSDALRTSQQLLTGVKCGDLQSIGFASQGRTDWVLAGYRIEVNGKLFAANGLVDVHAQEKLAASRASLMKILPEYEAKTKKTTLSEDEKAALKTEHALVRALSGRVVGATPWHEESDEKFQTTPVAGTLVENLRITLTGGSGPQQGTRNPVYLQAGARKFLLSSEAAPLADEAKPQMFELAGFELALNPLTKESLAAPGVGVIGSGAPTNKIPDRAQLQRVLLEVDGQAVYDSEKQPDDHKTLPALWLTPAAHFDEAGDLVRTTATASEVPVWMSGMKPTGTVIAQLPPEPPKLPPLITGPQIPPLPPPPLLPPDRTILPGGLPPPGGGILLPLLNALAQLLFPLPPPAAPLISGVRIAPTTPIVCDGDAVTVNWSVGGNTSQITSWRVDLFAVLPHKAAPVLITPMATNIGGFPGATSVVMPPINRAAVAALLIPASAESAYLYVQPRVTALGVAGNVLTAANGSILPLFPAGTPPPNVLLGLRRGPILPPLPPVPPPIIVHAPAPSFQVRPALLPPFLPWANMPLADPLLVRNAWRLTAEHGSHFGLLFASHESIPGATTLPAWSTAVRPTGNGVEQITFRCEGLVPAPAVLPGMRVIAHVGFVGGSSPATTGSVRALVELSNGPIRRNAAGGVSGAGAQPFFTLQTGTPLPLAKNTPLVLIDMPLRFAGAMDAGNFANYPLDPLNTAAYAPPGLPAAWNAASFGFNPVLYGPQRATGTMYVTITFRITLTSTDATDAVGVIGVRVVPGP